MKLYKIYLLLLLSVATISSYSQCIPDPAWNTDGISPSRAPDGTVGTNYSTIISFKTPKDTVIIYKIDRIARSLKGLIDIIELLKNKKVNLISLDSGDSVDTTSPMGKAFFQIAGVFAELERSMINARTKAGIEKAKIDGVKFSRTLGSKNPKTAAKIEKTKIFLRAGKSYD